MRMRIGTITTAFVLAGLMVIPAVPAQERRPQPEGEKIFVFSKSGGAGESGTYVFDTQDDKVTWTSGTPGTYAFLSSEMSFDRKVVKGAPYSAEVVNESVQSLVDGNRIVRRSTASVYRDSEGRTRREQTLGPIGPFAAHESSTRQTVFINDPVEGVSYILEPGDRSARKLKLRSLTVRVDEIGKAKAPEGEGQFEIELIPEPPAGAPPVVMRRGQMDRMRIERSMTPGDAKKESLGSQLIEGVQAEGTRITTTIPAGAVGNEMPINIVSERWYSPELQVVVLSKHSDPRFGESSYRLTNVSRVEPARSLFEVPADYTLKEGPPAAPRRPMRMRRPGVEN